MGIEILLHDLVMDLKRRRALNLDKLSYGLEIGARRFKCTTVPILREPHGLVAAICINIDTNYIREHVLGSATATAEFFRSYCATDMTLDENILSRPEYDLAVKGKKHWRDATALRDPLSG